MLRSGWTIGLLLAGSLWAQGAELAVAPAAHPLDARALGIAEALLDYCAQNDPTAAAQVRARLKQLVQGASKEALALARRSPEYRSAHDSEVAFVGKVDSRNAHRLCAQSAARSK